MEDLEGDDGGSNGNDHKPTKAGGAHGSFGHRRILDWRRLPLPSIQASQLRDHWAATTGLAEVLGRWETVIDDAEFESKRRALDAEADEWEKEYI